MSRRASLLTVDGLTALLDVLTALVDGLTAVVDRLTALFLMTRKMPFYGGEMEGVDLSISSQMEDLANVTQTPKQPRRALAVLRMAFAAIQLHTAIVQGAQTIE